MNVKYIKFLYIVLFWSSFLYADWDIDIKKKGLYDLSFKYIPSDYKMAVSVYIEKEGGQKLKIQNIDLEPYVIKNFKESYKLSKLLDVGKYKVSINVIRNNNLISTPTIISLKVSVGKPTPLIIDTDMMTDCDDAAALGVAHALEDNGEAKILAVMLSVFDTTDDLGYNGNTVSAINTYYNGIHNNIPIGVWHEILDNQSITNSMENRVRFSDHRYHKDILNHPNYTSDGKTNFQRYDGAGSTYDKYLQILEDENTEDNSIVIVVLGTNFNIVDFLKRDEYHRTLFGKKVKEVLLASVDSCNVNMCARYESGYNTANDTNAMFNAYLPNSVKVTVLDDQIGGNMYTGADYKTLNNPNLNPIYTAYLHASNDDRLVNGGNNQLTDNRSWDQVMVMLGVRGTAHLGNLYYTTRDNGHYFGSFVQGFQSFSDLQSGNAIWRTNAYKNHRKVQYDAVNHDYVKNVINTLMMQEPKVREVYPSDMKTKVYYEVENSLSYMSVSEINSRSATLSWDKASENELGFRIYKGKTLIETLDKDILQYTLYNLSPESSYAYRIVAFNHQGELFEKRIYFKTIADTIINDNVDYSWLIPVYHIILN